MRKEKRIIGLGTLVFGDLGGGGLRRVVVLKPDHSGQN